MLPEPSQPRPSVANGEKGWREMLKSGADGAGAEGVSLELLIDLQRAQAMQASDTR